MSNSFKKVVACLLAVLMVMFSVPFTALAEDVDTTEYTPDIQLQFGTIFNSVENTETWVDNFANGPLETSGRGAQPDLSASGLGGPILKATTSLDKANAKLTVKGLTIEADDTANYDNADLTPLDDDYNLQAGDAFTVTVRMDNLSDVYIATAEIAYSGNIEPLYLEESGSGRSYKSTMGTAAQGVATDGTWGTAAMGDYDAQALYDGINADEIGSELQTDYDGVNYMYAECIAPEGADWSAVNNANAPDLTNEDGTFGNEYENKSVMATFAFVLTEDLDADHPIYFWVHNGNTDAHKKDDNGNDTFSSFGEGSYSPARTNIALSTYTTYALNKFESGDNQFNGDETFGSQKMTFMGVNENVQGEEPPHEHEWSEWTVITPEVPATCTEDGTTAVETRTCACGESETRGGEVIVAPGHNYVPVTTEPTCTEGGFTTYTCSACQDSYTADFTDPNGHAWGEWEVTTPAVEATCTEDGTTAIERRDCANCDEYETRGGDVIPATGHTWSDWEVTTPAVEPTCVDAGATAIETRTCACGESESRGGEEIPATGIHTYSVAQVVAPTCTEGGYTEYVCIYCKDSYNGDLTDATGHTWGDWEVTTAAVAPTCTEAGATAIERRDCANCDEYETRGGEVVQATGHVWGISAINWATLNTTTGKVDATYVCANDNNHTKTENVQTTFSVTQQQSETLPEITTYSYTEGNFTDSKEVETKAPAGHTHTLVKTDEVAPTCTTAGTEAYWTCTGCQKMYSDAEAQNEIFTPIEIPATGHTWGDWEVTTPAVDATCVTDGATAVERRDCANCDEYETRGGDVVPATGVHAWGDWEVTTPAVAPTCTEAGSTAVETRECANCDATETRGGDVIPATGHVWGDWTETKPATATENGEETRYCENCDAFETREVVFNGLTITVPKYDIGTITLNGQELDGTKVNETVVAFGSEYTLAVTDGADNFKGWELNGKIVSEETTFTSAAYSNITVTPVFEVVAPDTMTVIFYDKFGNKVKEYKDYEIDAYQQAILADGIPTAPSYPSCSFVSWSMDDNAILGLTESATIWANYEDIESVIKYNVTIMADNTDITATALTLPDGIESDAVPYDTYATVYNENAKGWAIDGVVVSTSDTYSWYVGADITLTMLTASVEAKCSTTIIGGTLAPGAYKWNINATRNIVGGYKLVDSGFVYGKNLTDEDLSLDNEGKQGSNANSSVVRVVRSAEKNIQVNEFALNYGVKAMNAPVTAKSFIVVQNKTTGEVSVIYSDMATFNY